MISANARHLRKMSLSLQRHQNRIIALADAVARKQGPSERAVLLHGDLHAGNLLVGCNNELVAIDPTPALGEPEQDIGDAAAKNDWGQDLPTRVKQLAETCSADFRRARAYARLAAWNCGIFHAATGAEPPGGVNPEELLRYATTPTNVLVDTGFPYSCIERPPGPQPPLNLLVEMRPEDYILSRLSSIGLGAEDIHFLVCSHFDPDHAGNHEVFSNAELLVQRSHYEVARTGRARYEVVREHWDSPSLRYRLLDAAGRLLSQSQSDGKILVELLRKAAGLPD